MDVDTTADEAPFDGFDVLLFDRELERVGEEDGDGEWEPVATITETSAQFTAVEDAFSLALAWVLLGKPQPTVEPGRYRLRDSMVQCATLQPGPTGLLVSERVSDAPWRPANFNQDPEPAN